MACKKGIIISALTGGLALSATTVEAGGSLKVENGEDLAAKIILANSDPKIKMIKCIGQGACDYKGTLPTYTGSQQLKIDGKGSTIDASGITDTDVFASTGGGRLKLKRLNFIGGMSGVYVAVPAGQSDDVRVDLHRVSIRDAALHGLHIDDSAGAPAGVRLKVRFSEFADNGFGADEQDGLHVDETGDGRVRARVLKSNFLRNGSDGLSLDEAGAGNVSLVMTKGRIVDNGANPANPSDPEDGLDIDESGSGDVWLTIAGTRFDGNSDDGLDIDERDDGTIFGRLEEIRASENLDQGVTIDERQNGDFFVTIEDSTIIDNDASSSLIDIRANQDDGNGTLTLDNVTTGNVSLSGVVLITLP